MDFHTGNIDYTHQGSYHGNLKNKHIRKSVSISAIFICYVSNLIITVPIIGQKRAIFDIFLS